MEQTEEVSPELNISQDNQSIILPQEWLVTVSSRKNLRDTFGDNVRNRLGDGAEVSPVPLPEPHVCLGDKNIFLIFQKIVSSSCRYTITVRYKYATFPNPHMYVNKIKTWD